MFVTMLLLLLSSHTVATTYVGTAESTQIATAAMIQQAALPVRHTATQVTISETQAWDTTVSEASVRSADVLMDTAHPFVVAQARVPRRVSRPTPTQQQTARLVARYKVSGHQLYEMADDVPVAIGQQANSVYRQFAALVPDQWREEITEVVIYTQHDSDAFVDRDSTHQVLGMNLDRLVHADVHQVTELLLHELGHVVATHSSQYDQWGQGFDGTATHSYVNQFYQQFWANEEWMASEHFVSEAAQANAHEDFAESFRVFVLGDYPHDTHRFVNQKILFFYRYPELVALRSALWHNLQATP